MIRYPQALVGIEAEVTAESANWLTRAADRTALFFTLQRYTEEYTDAHGKQQKLAPFWGEVKHVYMRRQSNKCVYCETKLEGGEPSKVQWDLEHFRSKSNVRKWQKYIYPFSTGGDWPKGYYLLAYHLHNYAVSCKTCNTSFKSDYFPVAAARIAEKPNPADYKTEEAFLVYPLGDSDEDPEDLLTFVGADVIPKHTKAQDARKWRRGQVTIDFFDLNRDPLVYSRATWLLRAVWPNMQLMGNGDAVAKDSVDWFRSVKAPFTNCARCFIALCETNLSMAEQMLPIFKKTIEDFETG